MIRPVYEQEPEEAGYLELLTQVDAEIAQAATLANTFLAIAHERHGRNSATGLLKPRLVGLGYCVASPWDCSRTSPLCWLA